MKPLILGLLSLSVLTALSTPEAMAVKTEINSTGGLVMNSQLKIYEDSVLQTITKECIAQGAQKNTNVDLTVDARGNIVKIVLENSGLSSDQMVKLITALKIASLGDAGDKQSETLRITMEFTLAEVLAGAKSTGTSIKVTGGSITGDGTATGGIRIGGGGSIRAGGSTSITIAPSGSIITGGDPGGPSASKHVSAHITKKNGPDVFLPGDKAFVAQVQGILDTIAKRQPEPSDAQSGEGDFSNIKQNCDNIRITIETNDIESAKILAGEIAKSVDDCTAHKYRTAQKPDVPVMLAGNQLSHTAAWLGNFAQGPTADGIDGDIAESLFQSAYKLKLKSSPFDQFTLINLDQFCKFLEKKGKFLESAALWKQGGNFLNSTANGTSSESVAAAKRFYNEASSKAPGRLKHS